MVAVPTEGRHGLTAFRLSSVPLAVRRTAGAHLLRIAQESADAFGAISLTRAIESPSDIVYWVPTAAWEAATRRARWRT